MSISFHLPTCTYECLKAWPGIVSLKISWSIVPSLWKPTLSKVSILTFVASSDLISGISEGNKKDNITIIYTPGDNLKVITTLFQRHKEYQLILIFQKTGDMAVGQVSFHSDKKVWGPINVNLVIRCRTCSTRTGQTRWVTSPTNKDGRRPGPSPIVYIEKRENAIVNRLNKTKVEREVNHEQERVDRLKKETAIKRAAAAEKAGTISYATKGLHHWLHLTYQRKVELELAKQREEEKQARSYDTLFNNADDDENDETTRKTGRELEDDFMWPDRLQVWKHV